jgi:hypothetical protein
MNAYSEIKEIKGYNITARDVNDQLKRDGFHLIGIRIERPSPGSSGEFEDIAHYIIGKPVEDADSSSN